MAEAGSAACEPYKPKRAAAEQGTHYMPGVPLPQQKQPKQGARGAATAADAKSRPWESPEDLFSFKHLLTAGSEPVSVFKQITVVSCFDCSMLCRSGLAGYTWGDFIALVLQGWVV